MMEPSRTWSQKMGLAAALVVAAALLLSVIFYLANRPSAEAARELAEAQEQAKQNDEKARTADAAREADQRKREAEIAEQQLAVANLEKELTEAKAEAEIAPTPEAPVTTTTSGPVTQGDSTDSIVTPVAADPVAPPGQIVSAEPPVDDTFFYCMGNRTDADVEFESTLNGVRRAHIANARSLGTFNIPASKFGDAPVSISFNSGGSSSHVSLITYEKHGKAVNSDCSGIDNYFVMDDRGHLTLHASTISREDAAATLGLFSYFCIANHTDKIAKYDVIINRVTKQHLVESGRANIEVMPLRFWRDSDVAISYDDGKTTRRATPVASESHEKPDIAVCDAPQQFFVRNQAGLLELRKN